MLVTFIIALVGGLASLACCLYMWSKGQFNNTEDVKYQMFREEKGDE